MSEFLITEVHGQVGFITLNRPKALNALNLDMVRGLTATLLAWQQDSAITGWPASRPNIGRSRAYTRGLVALPLVAAMRVL
jgi:hypothetical protein